MTPLQKMHRRAQKAEGRVESAKYQALAWQEILGRSRAPDDRFAARRVLGDVLKSLGHSKEGPDE